MGIVHHLEPLTEHLGATLVIHLVPHGFELRISPRR